jgi:hypothetical protein
VLCKNEICEFNLGVEQAIEMFLRSSCSGSHSHRGFSPVSERLAGSGTVSTVWKNGHGKIVKTVRDLVSLLEHRAKATVRMRLRGTANKTLLLKTCFQISLFVLQVESTISNRPKE